MLNLSTTLTNVELYQNGSSVATASLTDPANQDITVSLYERTDEVRWANSSISTSLLKVYT